jgi:hypothetical protein
MSYLPPDKQPLNEDDTFRILRRQPMPGAYYEFREIRKHILLRDGLSWIDEKHPEVAVWLKDNGWTARELLSAYNKCVQEWRERAGIKFE